MSDDTRGYGQPFACAPGMRLEAHEKLAALQFKQIGDAVMRLEVVIERLEKRLWLTVYGVVAAILSETVLSMIATLP
jgi:hypothetical protein